MVLKLFSYEKTQLKLWYIHMYVHLRKPFFPVWNDQAKYVHGGVVYMCRKMNRQPRVRVIACTHVRGVEKVELTRL